MAELIDDIAGGLGIGILFPFGNSGFAETRVDRSFGGANTPLLAKQDETLVEHTGTPFPRSSRELSTIFYLPHLTSSKKCSIMGTVEKHELTRIGI